MVVVRHRLVGGVGKVVEAMVVVVTVMKVTRKVVATRMRSAESSEAAGEKLHRDLVVVGRQVCRLNVAGWPRWYGGRSKGEGGNENGKEAQLLSTTTLGRVAPGSVPA